MIDRVENLTRRDVLQTAGKATLSLTVLGAFSACQAQGHNKPPMMTHGILNIGQGTQYLAGTADARFLEPNGVIITNDGGTITAIQPICTHMGCTVAWDPDHSLFECPCHGSRFDIEGQVLHGPAKRALPRVPATKNPDGSLSIDLDTLPQPVKRS